MASADWTKAKQYYICNDVSLREVASKFKLSEASVFRRASKEKWNSEKMQFDSKVIAKAKQKAADKIAEKHAETFAEYAVEQQADLIELNRMLIEKAKQTLGLYDEALSPRDLKSISSMITDLVLNNEKMQATQASAASDKITVEFVKGEWDYGGPES